MSWRGVERTVLSAPHPFPHDLCSYWRYDALRFTELEYTALQCFLNNYVLVAAPRSSVSLSPAASLSLPTNSAVDLSSCVTRSCAATVIYTVIKASCFHWRKP